MTMNNIVNDKFLSYSARADGSQRGKKSSTQSDERELDIPVKRPADSDSLKLSQAGQQLQHAARSEVGTDPRPETPDQARALVARIRQQFELAGDAALSTYTAIKTDQMELLLRPASV